jgi:hypothetical protein
MSKTVEDAIREFQAEIEADERRLREKKGTVNTLCGVIGRPPIYSIESEGQRPIGGPIRPDQFYGRPLATAVRDILVMRQAANQGAASVNEIHSILVEGGYQFETKNEDIARKSLRNSLAKNTALFHKLPNGRFGLRAWYPNIRERSSGESAPRGLINTPPAEEEDEE